jgi:hypothetical protein
MKIRRSFGLINVELTSAEAALLFDELETVRGGARMPKLRQLCMALGASVELDKPPEKKRIGRPPGVKNGAVGDHPPGRRDEGCGLPR